MRVPFAVLLLFAACTTSDPEPADLPELLIDVRVSDEAVVVQAQEPALGCECSFGWTEVGSCRTQSDAFSCACDPWPASCLDEIVVLDASGEALAVTTWDPRWWAAFLSLDTDGAEAVSISGCGASVTTPIRPAPRPTASIEIAGDGIATWSTSPAASSSIVMLGDGYATASCHQAGGSGTVDMEDASRVAVTALASPLIGETELGSVRVWSGNTTGVAR